MTYQKNKNDSDLGIRVHEHLVKLKLETPLIDSKLAVENKIIIVNAQDKNQSQATFASLDKNIISSLENEWKFINVEKMGRTRWIKINKDGKNAAKFLI